MISAAPTLTAFYPELDFDIAVEQEGDMYARYRVRVKELRESVRIIKQILPRLEATRGESIWADGKPGAYAPAVCHLASPYGRVENGKGELGYYIVSAGGKSGSANPLALSRACPEFHQSYTDGHHEQRVQSGRCCRHPGQH